MELSFPAKPRRVGFMDELRGLDIIVMVVYHAMYDLVFIFGVDIPFFYGPMMHIVQPAIAIIFIVLSGISCRYSKSNLKRGTKTFLLGMLLTVSTLIFMPDQAIYFGILHFMGTAMIAFALLNPVLDRVPPAAGALVSFVLFLLTYRLPSGFFGIDGLFEIILPRSLYQYPFLLPFGFYPVGSDYFSWLPWLFLFFAGSYIGVFFVRDRMPDWLYPTRSRVLSSIGRRTIIIYLLHQPVIMGILYVVFWIIK